jgi:hypothetical protein
LESDAVRVKARYARVTSQVTGGALDKLNQALVSSPRRIYGAAPVVKVAEEKWVSSAWYVLTPSETWWTA